MPWYAIILGWVLQKVFGRKREGDNEIHDKRNGRRGAVGRVREARAAADAKLKHWIDQPRHGHDHGDTD